MKNSPFSCRAPAPIPISLTVHRCNFTAAEPCSISSIAVNSEKKLIAVARSKLCDPAINGVDSNKPLKKGCSFIEIWSIVNEGKLLIMRSLPYERNCSIEGLLWCQNRCFSAGSDGSVSEHSLWKLKPLATRQVSASPIWCMTNNPEETFLATGNDDGSVHLISVGKESFQLEKCFTGFLDSRILCLKWHPREAILVGGTMDFVQLWDVQSGRSLRRISVERGRYTKNVPTAVWALVVTQDFTIVTGDSLGRVSFWNGRTGTLIGSHTIHQADVLALELQRNDKRILATGIDPKIQQFDAVKLQSKRAKIDVLSEENSDESMCKWSPNFAKHLHSHDVRSLATYKDWLISGGLDSVIVMSRFPPKTVVTVPSIDPGVFTLAKSAKLLMIRYFSSISIWRLGKEKENQIGGTGTQSVQTLNLEKVSEKLVDIQCRNQLTASSISDDGAFVAYSSTDATKIFLLDSVREQPSLSRLLCTNARNLPAGSALKFLPDSSALLIGTDSGTVEKITFTSYSCVRDSESCPLLENQAYIRHLEVSEDGRFCAVLIGESTVSIVSLKDMKCIGTETWTSLNSTTTTLPNSVITGIRFSSVANDLLLLFGSGAMDEVDFSLKRRTVLGQKLAVLKDYRLEEHCAWVGLAVASTEYEKLIYVHSTSLVGVISVKKFSQVLNKTISRFKYVCFVDALETDSIVLAELSSEKIVKKLPPALMVKKFGTG